MHLIGARRVILLNKRHHPAASGAPVSVADGPLLTSTSPAATDYTFTGVSLARGILLLAGWSDYAGNYPITGYHVAGVGDAVAIGTLGMFAIQIPADGFYDVTMQGQYMQNAGFAGVTVRNGALPATGTSDVPVTYVGDVDIAASAPMDPGTGIGVMLSYNSGSAFTLRPGMTLVKDSGHALKFSSFATDMAPGFTASFEYAGMTAATFAAG